MENKKGGFKGFLITLAVILFSVVSFIIKILINSTPTEDFPSFTPIVIGAIFVASVGYLVYEMFFGKDSFYRKKRLEKRAKKKEDLKRTHEGKTLNEIFAKKNKQERVIINKKTNWILISLTIFILLCVIEAVSIGLNIGQQKLRKTVRIQLLQYQKLKLFQRRS